MDRKSEFVQSEERDSDGYWIYLKRGFCVNGGEHAIVEDTRSKAYDQLGAVGRCECDDCKS